MHVGSSSSSTLMGIVFAQVMLLSNLLIFHAKAKSCSVCAFRCTHTDAQPVGVGVPQQ